MVASGATAPGERMTKRSNITGADAVITMDVSQYAQQVKAASRNGMSKQGTHRVVGEIPSHVYFALMREYEERGEYLTGEDIKKYLREHPEYRTVTAIDSGNQRNAQIRVN